MTNQQIVLEALTKHGKKVTSNGRAIAFYVAAHNENGVRPKTHQAIDFTGPRSRRLYESVRDLEGLGISGRCSDGDARKKALYVKNGSLDPNKEQN